MNVCFDKFIVYPTLKKTEKEDDRAGLSSGRITQITPGRGQWEGVSSPVPPHLYSAGAELLSVRGPPPHRLLFLFPVCANVFQLKNNMHREK